MEIEQSKEATSGHTVTEGQSAPQWCGNPLPADAHRESIGDHDASGNCFQSAAKVALQLVRAHGR